MSDIKQCTKCKQYKNISLFSKDKSSCDGLDRNCKKCISEYNKSKKYKIFYKPQIVGSKICIQCKLEKDIIEFGINRTLSDGRNTKCKSCSIYEQNNKKYNVILDGIKVCTLCNRELSRKEFPINRRLKDGLFDWCRKCAVVCKYGLNFNDYQQLLIKFDNKCGICGQNKRLSIDHCHQTGNVRGLLCGSCNMVLGRCGDNLEEVNQFVNKILKYIQENNR